ncbi:MAG TPA: glycosyltransferase [Polyangia bacterium]|nr:glycosyltransferase [Polyangia bacterium]
MVKTPQIASWKDMPKVSIITRTKNRVLLLKRALQSVDEQTFGDWEHVIVNDGGEPAPVDEVVAARGDSRRARTRVIHNPRSLGMEAASNVGLRQAGGDYVVIHDDDDTWAPEFLAQTTAYLDSVAHEPSSAGVITHSVRVQERIANEVIVPLDVAPVNDWMENVTLFRLAANNPFPPISFLYRRSVLADIGYYREDLPVCGDWEFNLRFLSRYEIGVVPKPLARYHQRVSSAEGAYTNSVIGSGGLTIRRYEARVRNELLRKDLSEGKVGLGFLVNVSKSLEDIGGPIHNIGNLGNRHQTAFSYFKDKVWNLGTRFGLIRTNG